MRTAALCPEHDVRPRVRPSEETLHANALAYANMRKAKTIEYRRACRLTPYDDDKNNFRWLAHYEAYRDAQRAQYGLPPWSY